MKTKAAILATMIFGSILVVSCSNASGSSSSKSSDASLSSLTIEAAGSSVSLNQSFSSASLSYTANVSTAVSKITISAAATSSAASITGTGDKVLSDGSNTEKIVVSAEDGSTKTYTIDITRADYSISVSSPVDCSTISTPSFIVTGNYFNKSNTSPATITVSYSGTAVVNATINSTNSTWTATIDASAIGNTGSNRIKTLRALATWSDGTTQATYRSYSFSGGVNSYSISGTISLPSGITMDGKKLSVYIVGKSLWTAGGVDLADFKGSTLSYILYDVPNGTYTVNAHTYPASGDGSFVSGSYYDNTWTGVQVTVSSSDVSGQNLTLNTLK